MIGVIGTTCYTMLGDRGLSKQNVSHSKITCIEIQSNYKEASASNQVVQIHELGQLKIEIRLYMNRSIYRIIFAALILPNAI
jgi:hypothetical protein